MSELNVTSEFSAEQDNFAPAKAARSVDPSSGSLKLEFADCSRFGIAEPICALDVLPILLETQFGSWWLFGITIKKMGISTAARMSARTSKRMSRKTQRGIPQQRRAGFWSFSFTPSIVSSGFGVKLRLRAECKPAERGMIEYGALLLGLSSCGVDGNELIISPIEFFRRGFSPSLSNIQSVPNLDAVLPTSRLLARRNARLMRSGKLVRLPRASASLTRSSLSGSGFLEPTLSLSLEDFASPSRPNRKEPELLPESAVKGRLD